MEELKDNKQTLLEEVKNMEQQDVVSGAMTMDAFVQKLIELFHHYSDLKKEDYKGWISEEAYRIFEDGLRDPEELALWKRIEAAPEGNTAEIQDKRQLVITYIDRYPEGPRIAEARSMSKRLDEKLRGVLEEKDWTDLFNYSPQPSYEKLRDYMQKYPDSVHKPELDDLMWERTDKKSQQQLQRYYDDWRNAGGKHVEYAKRQLEAFRKWDDGNNPDWKDIFKLKHFKDEYSDFVLINDVNEKYESKRLSVLADMKKHPDQYTSKLSNYVAEGIFTDEELIREGIKRKGGNVDPKTLPELGQFSAKPCYEAIEGNTDVYLFGIPNTGKTCLLMGLCGAGDRKFLVDFKQKGGPYAAALKQYVDAGKVPGRTPGKFVTTINCDIIENRKDRRGVEMDLKHRINFVEMSGEEFAHKLANSEETNLMDMGRGTKELLRNKNRKVFFIVVDPTVDNVEFDYYEELKEGDNVVDLKPIKEHIPQEICLSKFIALFRLKENKEFMKRVDAIHFIVTKADTLGDDIEERKTKARDLLIEKYGGVIGLLIDYCKDTKRVNYATDYFPMVYPFSLGRFFGDGGFDYDKKSATRIVNVLRLNTAAVKRSTFLDKVRDALT